MLLTSCRCATRTYNVRATQYHLRLYSYHDLSRGYNSATGSQAPPGNPYLPGPVRKGFSFRCAQGGGAAQYAFRGRSSERVILQ
jgi:hypothetical protein